MKDELESTISWLFLCSAVYLAPHFDKWLGLLIGALFCILASGLWCLNAYKNWRLK